MFFLESWAFWRHKGKSYKKTKNIQNFKSIDYFNVKILKILIFIFFHIKIFFLIFNQKNNKIFLKIGKKV